MNTVAVVISLALLVTVASGLGYNSYNRYPSIRGNSWNTWGSRGGSLLDNGGWDIGHHGGYGSKCSFSSSPQYVRFLLSFQQLIDKWFT